MENRLNHGHWASSRELRELGIRPLIKRRLRNHAHRSLNIEDAVIYDKFREERDRARAEEKSRRLESLGRRDPLS